VIFQGQGMIIKAHGHNDYFLINAVYTIGEVIEKI